jgi:hypothetical protein
VSSFLPVAAGATRERLSAEKQSIQEHSDHQSDCHSQAKFSGTLVHGNAPGTCDATLASLHMILV